MKVLRALSGVRARFRALSRIDKLRLVLTLLVVASLGAIGSGVADRLHRSDILMRNTAAADAAAVHEKAFGPGQPLMIRLQGPPKVLRREGPAVARNVASLPGFSVLAPWHARWREPQPTPDQALLMVWVRGDFEDVSDHAVPPVRKQPPGAVKPPLNAQVTVYADIANAFHSETVSAIKRSEMIAFPALLVVLILVLGSPVAASLPLFLGGCAAAAGTGLLSIINDFTPLDVSSLSLASMLGLALGVDYSMLMVSRFRRELADGASVTDAAATAERYGGKTVRFAAVVLALAMAGVLVVAPAESFGPRPPAHWPRSRSACSARSSCCLQCCGSSVTASTERSSFPRRLRARAGRRSRRRSCVTLPSPPRWCLVYCWRSPPRRSACRPGRHAAAPCPTAPKPAGTWMPSRNGSASPSRRRSS